MGFAENVNSKKTFLYRHFDSSGKLLYVGISLSALVRLGQHASCSHWFEQIASVTLHPFDDRSAALVAEREAIEKEGPLYNIQYKTLPKAKVGKYEESADALVQRVVEFKPLYDANDAGRALSISGNTVRALWKSGRLGFVNVRTQESPKRMSTGWHLIEFVESLEANAAA